MKQNLIKNNAMFAIDLLKGTGIPPKSEPVGFIIIAVTILVPLVFAVSLFGFYYQSKVAAKIKQQDVLKLEKSISKLSGAVEIKQNLEKQKLFYNTCLSEVKSSVRKYSQWSPVMAMLLEEMPSSVALKGLEVEHEKIKKETPKKKDKSSKTETTEMIMTKLILQITNQDQGDYLEEVKDFRNRLYSSPVFGSKLQNIVFSRQAEQSDGKETISYQIECIFKPEL